jgi:hypothetical protein
MPFVRRSEVDPKVLKKHEAKVKANLRQQLHNPALTAEAKAELKAKIAQVSAAKVYSKDSPPPAGAISFSDED